MKTVFDRTLENTGAGIADCRKKLGLTKTQAAQKAGITRQDATRIEQGAGGVTWRKVMPYLDTLGIKLPQVITLHSPSMLDYYQNPEKYGGGHIL